MNHEESRLQQQCVAWFRAQYPQYAMLLTHPANEGNGNRVSGAIHKAEGTVAGVPDLLLFMPAEYRTESGFGATYTASVTTFHSLGIEFKTAKGKQSKQQMDFQKMYEAAENKYIVVRSFEQFMEEVSGYMNHVKDGIGHDVGFAYKLIVKAAEEREKAKFMKFIGKK